MQLASFEEHAKRVWSVDFSQTDPMRFLSGSDDGTVRLWSLNDEVSPATAFLEGSCSGNAQCTGGIFESVLPAAAHVLCAGTNIAHC